MTAARLPMQKTILFFVALLFAPSILFGATPHSLEGITALNVLVIDQSSTITADTREKIVTELKRELEANGIESKKEGVGALFVKISSTTVGKTTIAHIHLGIGEEAVIGRSHSVESFVLSYSSDDLVESEKIDAEVYDSVINFLMSEFLEQYHEDNEE